MHQCAKAAGFFDLYGLKTGRIKYNNVLQCNKLEKIVVSDASTLILLQKIMLLDKLVKNFSFIIPNEVYDEAVAKGKKIESKDAYLIESKVNKSLINVKKIKDKKKFNHIIKEFGLGKGEAEAVVLFLQERADVLAVDDHKAINVCRIYQIPFMTALTFAVSSYNNNTLNRDESKKMIERLGIYGRYKDEMIYRALSYLEAKK